MHEGKQKFLPSLCRILFAHPQPGGRRVSVSELCVGASTLPCPALPHTPSLAVHLGLVLLPRGFPKTLTGSGMRGCDGLTGTGPPCAAHLLSWPSLPLILAAAAPCELVVSLSEQLGAISLYHHHAGSYLLPLQPPLPLCIRAGGHRSENLPGLGCPCPGSCWGWESVSLAGWPGVSAELAGRKWLLESLTSSH